MPVSLHRGRGETVTGLHRRQRSVVVGFARGAFRRGLAVTGTHRGGSGGRRTTALPGGLHESGELDHRAGRLEHRLAVLAGRSRQTHGRGGAGGVGHLGSERALPDQRVQFQLVGGHLAGELRRVMEPRAGGSDAFVGLLRTSGLRHILLGTIGQERLSEMIFDGITGGGDGLLRQGHRIGSHIRDVTVLVQPLRGTHGLT